MFRSSLTEKEFLNVINLVTVNNNAYYSLNQ